MTFLIKTFIITTSNSSSSSPSKTKLCLWMNLLDRSRSLPWTSFSPKPSKSCKPMQPPSTTSSTSSIVLLLLTCLNLLNNSLALLRTLLSNLVPLAALSLRKPRQHLNRHQHNSNININSISRRNPRLPFNKIKMSISNNPHVFRRSSPLLTSLVRLWPSRALLRPSSRHLTQPWRARSLRLHLCRPWDWTTG